MIMSHKLWMELTYGGRTSRRSSKLKAVDSALKKYHSSQSKPDLEKLQGTLTAWMQEKGNSWKNSVRNKRGAVETLFMQINGLGGAGPIDANALRALKDETQQQLIILFRGAKIRWKSEFRGKLNSNLLKPWHSDFAARLPGRQLKTSGATNKYGTAINASSAAGNAVAMNSLRNGGSSGKVSQLVSKFVTQIVPAGMQGEVLKAVTTLVPNFQAEFTASVMPIAGLVTAAGGAVWNSCTAAKKQWGVHQAKVHMERSLAGVEANQAINALIRILTRERNADVFCASVSFTEFGGKLAGLAIDGGVASNTAVSLAANIVKLMNIIRIVYRDVKEKNAANALMQSNPDITIFEKCPLVGCYLICCLPTSALMSLIFDHFGQAGWMDNAERTVAKHIQPLRAKAREVIANHRFEIPTLSRFPGMLNVNEGELKRMAGRVGKTGMVGGGPGDFE